MTTLAIKYVGSNQFRLFWAIVTVVATVILLNFGITLNQGLALFFTAVVLTIWTNSKVNGLIAAVILFMVKPLFMRIAYDFDKNITGSGGFDLLGITPALLLAGLIIWHLYFRISGGENILVGRTRQLMLLFCAVAFLSIFNPANSLIVGFAGFERNILPNMMIMLTASFLFTTKQSFIKLTKILIILGLISCVYGIGQSLLGLYPWEKSWLLNVAFKENTHGWLTIGLSGLEFRLFSIFYSYMDFTFCNVLIFLMAISYGTRLSGKWQKLRYLYIILWIVVLALSLERMPLIMTIIGTGAVYLLRSFKAKRKKVLMIGTIAAVCLFVTLNFAEPLLKSSGADKLIRLAELANPLSATSISDRMNRNWEPTLKTIAANPLGVGIGFGSQTRANLVAAKSNLLVEPHNELLQKILETGVFGGLIFLILLISVFKDALKLGRFNSAINRFGYGFAAGTIAFWLCGIVNVPFSGSSGLLYWTLAGAVVGIVHPESLKASHCTKDEQFCDDKIAIESAKEENARSVVKKGS